MAQDFQKLGVLGMFGGANEVPPIFRQAERPPVADHLEVHDVAAEGARELDHRRHLAEVQRLDDEIEPKIT